MNDVPKTEKNVTDSWKAHEDFLGAINRFLAEIRMQDGEVWIGELCLGSGDHAWLRARLRSDAVDLVHHFVDRAKALVADVTRTLERALRVTRETVEGLQAKGTVEDADLARLQQRQAGLERLLEKLKNTASHSPLPWHPETLTRWYEILRGNFVPGNPAIDVRVVTTYLL